ncbi:sulfurtransferase TusA family protein [Clostridium guangxiense]|uniref:sulfurtransferase TusA family protein n=1 Tax=Clostridium guangxiense TaxID=1662055 RepID=UPI001E5B2A36|nr:sulfurtransferase TusA family protein [Clostridium guangxiense]MCD2347033.1 sulfurtransferase TusA family protein [Clostridium guangxiense]
MIDISKENFKEVEDFKEKAQQYLNSKIDPLRFKAFRVSMGVYEQREKETYMVRTRIPGGFITLDQFRIISKLGEKYSHGKIHLTSREDAQFHKVELKDVYTIMKELIENGILTKGTGGNTVRNIECSPLSGVSYDDVFDVEPYKNKVTNYLIKDPSTMNLPRKYKIAFSNSKEDTANASISDLGFIAEIKDGKKGFKIFAAGGLGGKPRAAIKIEDFIAAKDVLYYVVGLKRLFEREGDRTNKSKARIRFISYRFGDEKFKELLHDEVVKLKKEENLDLIIDESGKEKVNYEKLEYIENLDEKYENVLFKQKQSGYYSAYVHPECGNLKTDDLNKVLDFISKLDYRTSIRLTNTQGFFIRDLKGNDAVKLAGIIEAFSSNINLFNSSTCAGASTCQLGLCLSQNLLVAIKESFKTADAKVKKALPKIYISGCLNSCAQHEKGAIGLNGRASRTDDGLVPMYTVSFGGYLGFNGAKLAEAFGDVPARKIPKYLLKLAEFKVKTGYEDFYEFLNDKKDEIKSLTKEFGNIESYSENPDLYYDFKANKKFSLEGRGKGECSTGVLDVIKMDISNAEAYIAEYGSSKENLKLYEAALSACRALLILKGIDTTKEREIFSEFIDNFVNEGYLNKNTKGLIDSLIDFKMGDIGDLSDKVSEVRYVVKRVKDMFESLDGKLDITLPKENEDQVKEETLEKNEGNEYKIVDFRGVKCPINFVKVKIELSKVKSGNRLGVYLDDGDPITNVPRSVEKEGNKIISIDTNYDGYNLLVIEKK